MNEIDHLENNQNINIQTNLLKQKIIIYKH